MQKPEEHSADFCPCGLKIGSGELPTDLFQISRFPPIIQYQTVYSREVFGVVCDQDVSQGSGMGSNHFVSVLVLLIQTLLPQFCQDSPIVNTCIHIKIKDDDTSQKTIQCFRVLGKRRPEFVRPFVEQLKIISESDENRVVRIHCLGAIRATASK